MPVSDLTVENILAEIMKVLQSKKFLQLDTDFNVEVIMVKRSVGAGTKPLHVWRCSEDYIFSPNTRATIPIHVYINNTNQSPDTIRWLQYIAYNEGIAIRHAHKGSGEEQARFYYGRPIFYDPYHVHSMKDVYMATIKEKIDKTSAVIRSQDIHVVKLWELEFTEQK
ncbi:uncharacterized protein CEXT_661911 [Caerostris extrusa]|uniref:Uncharacterized protein n=1 Tax=Caerostris extrusa TaxID=172846 RepID=A0AAV4XXC6_CAEEX|nr:uncharacterized protein CEXT_661911 [Caerostris extrusa]